MYGCAALEPEPESVRAPAAGASKSPGTAAASTATVLFLAALKALLLDLNGVPFCIAKVHNVDQIFASERISFGPFSIELVG